MTMPEWLYPYQARGHNSIFTLTGVVVLTRRESWWRIMAENPDKVGWLREGASVGCLRLGRIR